MQSYFICILHTLVFIVSKGVPIIKSRLIAIFFVVFHLYLTSKGQFVINSLRPHIHARIVISVSERNSWLSGVTVPSITAVELYQITSYLHNIPPRRDNNRC